MQSNVFNKEVEWLEVEEKKRAFCGDTETAVTTQHIIEPELSHSVNQSEQQTPTKSLNFLITFTVFARSLAQILQHKL